MVELVCVVCRERISVAPFPLWLDELEAHELLCEGERDGC